MRIVLLDITGGIRNVSWSTHTTFVTGCPRRWTDRDVLATSRLATSAYWILRGAVTQPPVEERTTATSVYVCVSVCPFASVSPKLLVVCVGLTVVTDKPRYSTCSNRPNEVADTRYRPQGGETIFPPQIAKEHHQCCMLLAAPIHRHSIADWRCETLNTLESQFEAAIA